MPNNPKNGFQVFKRANEKLHHVTVIYAWRNENYDMIAAHYDEKNDTYIPISGDELERLFVSGVVIMEGPTLEGTDGSTASVYYPLAMSDVYNGNTPIERGARCIYYADINEYGSSCNVRKVFSAEYLHIPT